MRIRQWQRMATRLVLIAGLLPGAVVAQTEFSVSPSVKLTEIYDDNLFGSAAQQEDDLISRLSPAIAIEHRSGRLTLTGLYTQDAESYRDHAELDSTRARQHTATGFRFDSTPRLTLSGDASYTETETPGELNLTTGLERARAHAERLAVSPSLKYTVDPVTVGTAGYTFTRDKLAGGIGSDTQMATLGLERRVTRSDTARVAYGFHRFLFDGEESTDVHVLTFGGTHAFSDRTSATLMGGSRFTNGSSDPEISGSLRHAYQQGDLSVSYARGQTTALGLAGAVTTEAVEASAAYSPTSTLEIRVGPSWVKSTRGAFEADVYRMTLDVRHRIARYLAFFGSYLFSTQQGSLDVPGEVEINRNVIMLGVVFAPAPRARETSGRDAAAGETVQ